MKTMHEGRWVHGMYSSPIRAFVITQGLDLSASGAVVALSGLPIWY